MLIETLIGKMVLMGQSVGLMYVPFGERRNSYINNQMSSGSPKICVK